MPDLEIVRVYASVGYYRDIEREDDEIGCREEYVCEFAESAEITLTIPIDRCLPKDEMVNQMKNIAEYLERSIRARKSKV
jgi:hypothetical protein